MENEIEQTLSQVYKRKKTDQDIFPELMDFKVKEVLLIANHYDAYSIVREGRFFDRIYGEFLQLNLYTAPRITSAANTIEAVALMKKRHFDMVILMAGLDKKTPVEISKIIKEKYPDMPLLAMVNNNSDLRFFDEAEPNMEHIDRVFVWNGDSKVFLAMIKYVEDKMNVEKDTKIGDVRVILLVEDSQKYYTRYLPLLYSIIMKQTQAVLNEEGYDQLHKLLKMRARPKVLLVSNYEDAIEIVEKYKEYLICIISDVKYQRNGVPDEDAGVELIRYVKSITSLPALLQSSDPSNAIRAKEVGADFIDKNSESLSQDIYDFIHHKLGFGNFIFKNSRGVTVATARNLMEFSKCIEDVSAESLLYHAKRNGISTWLMARGEINMAKRLRPYKIEDFESSNKLRQAILKIFEQVKIKRLRGRVVLFESSLIDSNRYITRIGEGSFGGKGRGLAFLCHFVENIDFKKILPDLDIRIPTTAIIGADEFSDFIERNKLFRTIYVEQQYDSVRELFLEATFNDRLNNQLRKYVTVINEPLAVRSSGLFEDSLRQPFAGVYETFMLPNNHPDIEVRLEQLITAIKLVYASIFSPSARAYFEAVNYKIEEEKMAIIIQKIVGETAHHRFYPHISGIAQSYNYYPFSYMKPEDGFAVLGVGLGKYVVGGEKAWRFCPKYPNLELNSIQDQVNDSQAYFYALDLNITDSDVKDQHEDSFIRKLPMKEAEEDGNLKYCASVYDYNYDRITNNLNIKGPRIINFANILKYDYIPLAKSLDLLLQFCKEAMGAPVEIEFAVDLNAEHHMPTLYLLQIKPLIRIENNINIDFDQVDTSKVILASEKGMGNGVIEHIKDVIFMAPEKFNRVKTDEMAHEIAQLNKQMEEQGKEYLLIGPGRWGTRDKFTGIPVLWSQISHAKVIVEMGLKDFPLEASLGSHFFHNVTSMNVGYFSIHHNKTEEFVNFEMLKKQNVIAETTYFTHVEFNEPLQILMDGKQQKAMVSWQESEPS